MKTKLLYSLVSSPDDYYLEQLFLSSYSAKKFNPGLNIVLLIDDLTASTLNDPCRKNKTKYIDEIIVVNLDGNLSPQHRSRLLRTTAREHVEGDFFALDTDTIIIKPLDYLDSIENSLAACYDCHALLKENPYRDLAIRNGETLGWPVSDEEIYYNGGALYSKDDETSRRFYRLWNTNYAESRKKGITMDQPSFAKSNYEAGNAIAALPPIFNVQLKHGTRYLKDAAVIHYLWTSKNNSGKVPFILNDLKVFEDLRECEGIPKYLDDLTDDIFTGFAQTTQISAGDDLDFFNTLLYTSLRSWYNKKTFYRRLTKLLTLCFKIKENTAKILKPFSKRK